MTKPKAPAFKGKKQLPKGARLDDRITVPDDPVDENKKMGRPSLFKFEYLERVTSLCLLNLSNREIAFSLKVSEDTLAEWIETYPDFRTAMHDGREGADSRVARALMMRAVGYSHDSEDIRTISIGDGMSEIVRTPIVKHYPPDTGAATMWLTNRRKHLWRAPNATEGNDDVTSQEKAAAVRAAIRAALDETPDEPAA